VQRVCSVQEHVFLVLWRTGSGGGASEGRNQSFLACGKGLLLNKIATPPARIGDVLFPSCMHA
jgi:hypothetical protein